MRSWVSGELLYGEVWLCGRNQFEESGCSTATALCVLAVLNGPGRGQWMLYNDRVVCFGRVEWTRSRTVDVVQQPRCVFWPWYHIYWSV